MDNSSIKDNIRKVRKARKLTQEELADRLDISLTAYRDLEKGDTVPYRHPANCWKMYAPNMAERLTQWKGESPTWRNWSVHSKRQ